MGDNETYFTGHREQHMRHWDGWMEMVRGGFSGDIHRLGFETILDEGEDRETRLAAARQRIAELETAIAPFAKAFTWFESRVHEDDIAAIDEATHMIGCEITVADLRRARVLFDGREHNEMQEQP